jgi:hypothetical protein
MAAYPAFRGVGEVKGPHPAAKVASGSFPKGIEFLSGLL